MLSIYILFCMFDSLYVPRAVNNLIFSLNVVMGLP